MDSGWWRIIFFCNFLRPATHAEKNHFVFESDAGNNIDYYFVYGKTIDDIIGGYGCLPAKHPLFQNGHWVFGKAGNVIKHRMKFYTHVQNFGKRKIPIDNIVLDWNYWRQPAMGQPGI